ncbi:tRNA-intron lyase [Sulfuracidifex tepidarius]|uniref:tRNA-splicing endonuclease n=1 Tax=Sulfuracidifex tepidarius TaxID=1294262 RepID=A0A510DVK2_9CREN|nr:tRNA-intron lyase [Sulfuracidifex tepidarius]BBG24225.1 tRNA-splicing endonuclease [Sulfuracidifex tepidarius]BBG26982.1 tRNA-splicing endonuclease [Sulfuracidifex tepidarius]
MQGILLENRVVVVNIEDAREIYKKGFFGKPLGVPKPKGPEEVDRPLELSFVESLYLMENFGLEIVNLDGKKVTKDELTKHALATVDRFNVLYAVYSDLRKKKFIVRSGIKFGADFAVYTMGPGIEHAPFVVIALDINNEISPLELMSFGRVSHSTRKTLVLAMVDLKKELIKYTMFKWVKM